VSRTCSAIATIVNKLGLHARPAMMFVETANKFQADVKVRRADASETFDGKSIMQMMMLAGTCGTKIEILAKGDDAEDAVKAITELIESKFEEE
jgi:phosphocarrier protein HPr